MDGHPHARGEGGLAQWAGGGRCRGSGWRDAEGGVEPVEGLLAGLKFPRQPQARRLDQVNPNTISAASSLARSTVWSGSSPDSRPPNPGARTIRSQSSGTVDGPSSSGEDGGHGRPRPLDRATAGTSWAAEPGGARPADPTVAAGRAPAGQATGGGAGDPRLPGGAGLGSARPAPDRVRLGPHRRPQLRPGGAGHPRPRRRRRPGRGMPPRHRRVVPAGQGPRRHPPRSAGPDRPHPRRPRRDQHHHHPRPVVAAPSGCRRRGAHRPGGGPVIEPIPIPDATLEPAAYVRALVATLGDREPLEVLSQTPTAVRSICEELTDAQWRRPMAHREWNALQVVGHLLDVEVVYGFRWRLILTEDRPSYPGYDEKRWSLLPRPAPTQLLAALEGLRAVNLAVLDGVDDDAATRSGVHNEQGQEQFDLTVRKVAGHDLAHLNQLARTVAAATVAHE